MRRSGPATKLRQLHSKMRDNLVASGISNVDQFVNTLDDKSDGEIEEYAAWLSALPEYKAFMTIWGLKTPDWWANLRMLGETNLREHKLLNPLAKELRRVWRTKHSKKGSNVKATAESHQPETDPREVCVRPAC